MVYVKSSEVSEDIVDSILYIDKVVYDSKYTDSKESILDIFNKCPESFILAYDDKRKNKLVGYLCYLPINHNLFQKIFYLREFHDSDIKSKDMVDINKFKYVLVLSVAVLEDYRYKGIGATLLQEFENIICINGHKDAYYRCILACTVSEEGEHLFNRFKYVPICDKSVTKDYNIYVKYVKSINGCD